MNLQTDSQNTRRLRRTLGLLAAALVIIGGIALLLAGSISTGGGETTLPAQDQAPLPESGPAAPGAPPPEFTLQDLDGNPVSLSQFLGRSIVVNFWATWCGPCRLEMPEIQATFAERQDDGLVVLALNQDETAAEVEAYFAELGLTFQPLLDVDRETALNYGLGNTLPSTVVIDTSGETVAVHRGLLTREQLNGYLADATP